MLIPGTNLQGNTISDLPRVVTPDTELPGALHEVETPTGPNGDFENKGLTTEQLVEYLAARLGSGGAGGAAAVFGSDIVVSLANGRSFGKYLNGQTIPAAGKTANEVVLLATREDILPTYATASVGVSQSAPADGEVGESVSNTITGTFYQGDAGPVTAMREYRGNQAQIGASSTSSPISRTVQMVRALTPTGIWAVADYAAGPRKNVAPAGTPDTRTPGIRNPNAPQAAETGLSSSVIYFTGYYRLFYGATSAAPGNSAAARALPSSQLTNQGNQGTLLTGTSALRFAIVLPPGRTLQSVTDLDNQGLNLTAKYVAQAPISVADAGGNAVSGYTPYVLSVATPYTSSARHLFTYA
jgi:hypothetical protein